MLYGVACFKAAKLSFKEKNMKTNSAIRKTFAKRSE